MDDDRLHAFLPLPSATLHILVALAPGEKHGYAIMRDVEELSDGAVRMGPGTLYGSIKRMLADGLIEEAPARPAPARRAGPAGGPRAPGPLTGLGPPARAPPAGGLRR